MIRHVDAIGNTPVIRNSRLMLFSGLSGFLLISLFDRSASLAAGILIFATVLGLALHWPQIGTFVFLFSVYSNISVLAMKSQKVTQAVGTPGQNPLVFVVLAALSLFLVIPLFDHLIVRRGRLIFDRTFVLMLAFFTASLMSSFFSQDSRIAEGQAFDYLFEGFGIYFVVVNVVRDLTALRRATWALLMAGTLMASISILQKATHTQNRLYAGFGQIVSEPAVNTREPAAINHAADGNEDVGQVRAAGPIGESNRYGEVLLVLVPLAVFLIRTERSRRLRGLALFAVAVVSGGVLLTFSRECFLAALVVFCMMIYLRVLTQRQALVSAVALALLIAGLAPGTVKRMATLEHLGGLLRGARAGEQAPDSSAVRRYVLNVAAWRVFLGHPLLGVGPGQFAEHYSSVYANRVGLVESTLPYMGHNLYLDTMAENGLVGLACFSAILLSVMARLWNQWTRLRSRCPELAQAALAFLLALCAFAITAVFAHMSYQRYFWLLLALSSAAGQILSLSPDSGSGPSTCVGS